MTDRPNKPTPHRHQLPKRPTMCCEFSVRMDINEITRLLTLEQLRATMNGIAQVIAASNQGAEHTGLASPRPQPPEASDKMGLRVNKPRRLVLRPQGLKPLKTDVRGEAMREIKFRAIDESSGQMVFGNLIVGKVFTEPLVQIENTDANDYQQWQVRPETVGQFTGLVDKSGVEIYEDDILRDPQRINGHQVIQVFWSDNMAMFMIHNSPRTWSEDLHHVATRVEVLGNIHEHSHLLGGNERTTASEPSNPTAPDQ